MASLKRARPAFSPPRPRKAVATSSTSKTTTSKSSLPKPTTKPIRKSVSKSTSTTTEKGKTTEPIYRRRSRLVSPTPSASDSLGDDDSHSEDHDNDISSPEPDYILAEVIHEPATAAATAATTTSSITTAATIASSTKPPIPLDLLHRILHAHFSNPDTTKMSLDARDLAGKYIEVFVREAIMRCACEKTGGVVDGSVADSIAEGGGGGAWLELEDLEKVAVQMCLDF